MKLTSLIIVLFLPSFLFSQSCLPDGIDITSQTQIDSFAINYPNCTEIEGYVLIAGGNITSLAGLDVIESINGGFAIWGCNGLFDLTGMENLTTVGGRLQIVHNDSLTNLLSLSSLLTIGGDLQIIGNVSLTTLDGLDNIDENSIGHLSIFWNDSLSKCHIENICSYLASSESIIDIYSNSQGCNSQEEVEEACESVDIFENTQIINGAIFPNPARSVINYSHTDLFIIELNIYNQLGEKVLTKFYPENTINVSALNTGMYLVEFITPDLRFKKKLILE